MIPEWLNRQLGQWSKNGGCVWLLLLIGVLTLAAVCLVWKK